MRTEIDFLNEEDKIIKAPRRKMKAIGKMLLFLLIFFAIAAGSALYGVISSGENLSKTFGNVGLWGQISQLISSGDKKIAGEDDDRVNILLLGIGGFENGKEHDGPFLTDTIILGSFKPKTRQAALISIPRDLVMPVPGYGWRKINAANAYGEAQNSGQGGELARQAISESLGVDIPYYIRLDFAGFKQIIDDLGGIDVDVEHVLDDRLYPIPGKETATTSERYEHLYIEAGQQHFDGERALKFVRSRQAGGAEGSDFARSKRQQKVLLATKEKGLSFGALINPYKISNVMDTLSRHLATNLQVWEIIRLFNLGKEVGEENIIHRVFDDSAEGLLVQAVTEDGAYVLRPADGNFSAIKLVVQNIFDLKKIERLKPKAVEIQNGTKIGGLALRFSQYLESVGYQVIKIGNAPTQDYQKTVVYNLSSNANDQSAAAIAGLLDSELAPTLPDWLKSTTSPKVSAKADVLVILGQDKK